jgi:catalase
VIIIQGDESLQDNADALDFVRQQYRHCKPIYVIGDDLLLGIAGVPSTFADGTADPAIIIDQEKMQSTSLAQFKTALAGHRSFEREKARSIM